MNFCQYFFSRENVSNYCLSDQEGLDGSKQGFLGIAIPIFCLVGVFGNIVNLTIFLDRRQPVSTTRTYLIAMTVVHIFTLTSEGLMLAATHSKRPFLELAIAYVLWPAFGYGFLLSLGCVVALTWHVYSTITKLKTPQQRRADMTEYKWRPYIVMALIAAVVFVFTLPMVLVIRFDPDDGCYKTRWPWSPFLHWYSMIGLFIYVVPCLLAMTSLSVMMISFLCRQTTRMAQITGPRSRRIQRERNFAIAVVTFLLFSWLMRLMALVFNPLAAPTTFIREELLELKLFDEAESIFAKMTWVAAGLVAAEFSLTFVFYFAIVTTYREILVLKIQNLLCCLGVCFANKGRSNSLEVSSDGV